MAVAFLTRVATIHAGLYGAPFIVHTRLVYHKVHFRAAFGKISSMYTTRSCSTGVTALATVYSPRLLGGKRTRGSRQYLFLILVCAVLRLPQAAKMADAANDSVMETRELDSFVGTAVKRGAFDHVR